MAHDRRGSRIATWLFGVLGGLALLGLGVGVAVAGPGGTARSGTSDSAAEAVDFGALALSALEDPAPAPSTGPSVSSTGSSTADAGRGRPARPIRAFLRRNVLHGETVVQTKRGKITVAVQRGTVTATDGKSMTVKSSDGFAQTWVYAAKVTIRKDHKKADAGAIPVGATVGVAGVKDGGTSTARFIVVG